MEIPNDIFDIYEEAVDALLANSYIGKDAQLYYQKKVTSTENGLSGDPEVEDILLDTIKLRIYSKTRQWTQVGGVQFVDGRSQIFGLMSDVPKIKKCVYLLIEGHRYTLTTEPQRHGFGDKYFTAFIDLIK